MTPRQLLLLAAAAAVVTALGIAVLDVPIARALAGADKSAYADGVGRGLDVLDHITLVFGPTKEQLVIALIVAGGIAWTWRRPVGHALLLFGLTYTASRIGGGYLKEIFGRLRPSEALAAGHVDDSFFYTDAYAFPSGHVSHYAALALTIAVLVPRARIPALALIGCVAFVRITANAHFLSDAAAALAIAALGCAGAEVMLRRLDRA